MPASSRIHTRPRRSRPPARRRAPQCPPVRIQLAILLGAFAGATGIAAIAGATNFGTALTFGQIAFAGALVWIMLTR